MGQKTALTRRGLMVVADSENWTIPALIIMSAWGADNTMIIYLAGLQSIPDYLYDAASIDGAGRLVKFWNVTVPMMSPVIFFNMVTGFITSLQAFVLILVMTNQTESETLSNYNESIMSRALASQPNSLVLGSCYCMGERRMAHAKILSCRDVFFTSMYLYFTINTGAWC